MGVRQEGEEIGIIIRTAAMKNGATIGVRIARLVPPEGAEVAVKGTYRSVSAQTIGVTGLFGAGQDGDLG